MKSVVTLFVILFFHVSLTAQIRVTPGNIDSINYYTKTLTDSSINWIYRWENGESTNLSGMKEKQYPGVKIDSVNIYPVIKLVPDIEEDAVQLQEMTFGDSSEVCIIAYPFLKVYGCSGVTPYFWQLGMGQDKQVVTMVQEATQHSFNSIGFCYFLNSEKYSRDILIEKNVNEPYSTKFWYKSNEYKSLTGLIVGKYGSVKRFVELRSQEEAIEKWQMYRDSLVQRFDIPVNYKSFVKDSWRFRNEAFRTDTIGNVKFFTRQLKACVPGVSTTQLYKLYKDIYATIKRKDGWLRIDNSYDSSALYFMGKDILPIIKSSLSPGQFSSFTNYSRPQSALYYPISNYISNNLPKLADWKDVGDRMGLDVLIKKYQEFIKSIFTQEEQQKNAIFLRQAVFQ